MQQENSYLQVQPDVTAGAQVAHNRVGAFIMGTFSKAQWVVFILKSFYFFCCVWQFSQLYSAGPASTAWVDQSAAQRTIKKADKWTLVNDIHPNIFTYLVFWRWEKWSPVTTTFIPLLFFSITMCSWLWLFISNWWYCSLRLLHYISQTNILVNIPLSAIVEKLYLTTGLLIPLQMFFLI